MTDIFKGFQAEPHSLLHFPERADFHTPLASITPRQRFAGSYRIRRATEGARWDGKPFWKLWLSDETGLLLAFVWPDHLAHDPQFRDGEEVFIEARTRWLTGRVIADILSFDHNGTY